MTLVLKVVLALSNHLAFFVSFFIAGSFPFQAFLRAITGNALSETTPKLLLVSAV